MRYLAPLLLVLAACHGEPTPSKESYEPLWCPRPVSANSACARVDAEACQRLSGRECAPLDTFACYETDFTSVQEACFATLAGCEHGRAESVAGTLEQHRDRVGPCTVYRARSRP